MSTSQPVPMTLLQVQYIENGDNTYKVLVPQDIDEENYCNTSKMVDPIICQVQPTSQFKSSHIVENTELPSLTSFTDLSSKFKSVKSLVKFPFRSKSDKEQENGANGFNTIANGSSNVHNKNETTHVLTHVSEKQVGFDQTVEGESSRKLKDCVRSYTEDISSCSAGTSNSKKIEQMVKKQEILQKKLQELKTLNMRAKLNEAAVNSQISIIKPNALRNNKPNNQFRPELQAQNTQPARVKITPATLSPKFQVWRQSSEYQQSCVQFQETPIFPVKEEPPDDSSEIQIVAVENTVPSDNRKDAMFTERQPEPSKNLPSSEIGFPSPTPDCVSSHEQSQTSLTTVVDSNPTYSSPLVNRDFTKSVQMYNNVCSVQQETTPVVRNQCQLQHSVSPLTNANHEVTQRTNDMFGLQSNRQKVSWDPKSQFGYLESVLRVQKPHNTYERRKGSEVSLSTVYGKPVVTSAVAGGQNQNFERATESTPPNNRNISMSDPLLNVRQSETSTNNVQLSSNFGVTGAAPQTQNMYMSDPSLNVNQSETRTNNVQASGNLVVTGAAPQTQNMYMSVPSLNVNHSETSKNNAQVTNNMVVMGAAPQPQSTFNSNFPVNSVSYPTYLHIPVCPVPQPHASVKKPVGICIVPPGYDNVHVNNVKNRTKPAVNNVSSMDGSVTKPITISPNPPGFHQVPVSQVPHVATTSSMNPTLSTAPVQGTVFGAVNGNTVASQAANNSNPPLCLLESVWSLASPKDVVNCVPASQRNETMVTSISGNEKVTSPVKKSSSKKELDILAIAVKDIASTAETPAPSTHKHPKNSSFNVAEIIKNNVEEYFRQEKLAASLIEQNTRNPDLSTVRGQAVVTNTERRNDTVSNERGLTNTVSSFVTNETTVLPVAVKKQDKKTSHKVKELPVSTSSAAKPKYTNGNSSSTSQIGRPTSEPKIPLPKVHKRQLDFSDPSGPLNLYDFYCARTSIPTSKEMKDAPSPQMISHMSRKIKEIKSRSSSETRKLERHRDMSQERSVAGKCKEVTQSAPVVASETPFDSRNTSSKCTPGYKKDNSPVGIPKKAVVEKCASRITNPEEAKEWVKSFWESVGIPTGVSDKKKEIVNIPVQKTNSTFQSPFPNWNPTNLPNRQNTSSPLMHVENTTKSSHDSQHKTMIIERSPLTVAQVAVCEQKTKQELSRLRAELSPCKLANQSTVLPLQMSCSSTISQENNESSSLELEGKTAGNDNSLRKTCHKSKEISIGCDKTKADRVSSEKEISKSTQDKKHPSLIKEGKLKILDLNSLVRKDTNTVALTKDSDSGLKNNMKSKTREILSKDVEMTNIQANSTKGNLVNINSKPTNSESLHKIGALSDDSSEESFDESSEDSSTSGSETEHNRTKKEVNKKVNKNLKDADVNKRQCVNSVLNLRSSALSTKLNVVDNQTDTNNKRRRKIIFLGELSSTSESEMENYVPMKQYNRIKKTGSLKTNHLSVGLLQDQEKTIETDCNQKSCVESVGQGSSADKSKDNAAGNKTTVNKNKELAKSSQKNVSTSEESVTSDASITSGKDQEKTKKVKKLSGATSFVDCQTTHGSKQDGPNKKTVVNKNAKPADSESLHKNLSLSEDSGTSESETETKIQAKQIKPHSGLKKTVHLKLDLTSNRKPFKDQGKTKKAGQKKPTFRQLTFERCAESCKSSTADLKVSKIVDLNGTSYSAIDIELKTVISGVASKTKGKSASQKNANEDKSYDEEKKSPAGEDKQFKQPKKLDTIGEVIKQVSSCEYTCVSHEPTPAKATGASSCKKVPENLGTFSNNVKKESKSNPKSNHKVLKQNLKCKKTASSIKTGSTNSSADDDSTSGEVVSTLESSTDSGSTCSSDTDSESEAKAFEMLKTLTSKKLQRRAPFSSFTANTDFSSSSDDECQLQLAKNVNERLPSLQTATNPVVKPKTIKRPGSGGLDPYLSLIIKPCSVRLEILSSSFIEKHLRNSKASKQNSKEEKVPDEMSVLQSVIKSFLKKEHRKSVKKRKMKMKQKVQTVLSRFLETMGKTYEKENFHKPKHGPPKRVPAELPEKQSAHSSNNRKLKKRKTPKSTTNSSMFEDSVSEPGHKKARTREKEDSSNGNLQEKYADLMKRFEETNKLLELYKKQQSY